MPVLAQVLGPEVTLVESAAVTAQAVRETLGHEGHGAARITHFVTGDAIAYKHTAAVIGGVEGEIVALPVGELKLC
jgi:glutamate racemase